MRISKKVKSQIESQLMSDEQLKALELCQIRNNMGKQALNTIGRGIVKAVLAGGQTRGGFTLVWIAVTNKRLLLCKTDRYHQTVGEASAIPLQDMKVRASGTILRTLEILSASSGDSIIKLNFGLRRGALQNIQQAIDQ